MNPLIERVFGIMLRANAFLPAPEMLEGQSVDVEYVGPLARSQKMEEAVAVERLYQLAMQVAQVDPSIMDIINHDEAIRTRAALLGVPKSILKSVVEVDQMRQDRAMQEQMQQEIAMQQQQASATASNATALNKLADPQTQAVMSEVGAAAEEQGLMEE